MLSEIVPMLFHDKENIAKDTTGVKQGVHERSSDALQRQCSGWTFLNV